MTYILFDLGLPGFNTVIVNGSFIFLRCNNSCLNSIIQHPYLSGY
jgi:hypothetical protein